MYDKYVLFCVCHILHPRGGEGAQLLAEGGGWGGGDDYNKIDAGDDEDDDDVNIDWGYDDGDDNNFDHN